MSEARTPRTAQTRETSTRYEYQPPSTLPEPTPEPGWTYRWIATHILGQSDPSNVSLKMRDGWEPVKASDHPELRMAVNASGNVEIGGLMLCRAPEERMRARNEYYQSQAQKQVESVDNHFMKNNDPRMPLYRESSSTVQRGGGFGSGSK
jgi:hypothetical protein